jgi:hypothetical protein
MYRLLYLLIAVVAGGCSIDASEPLKLAEVATTQPADEQHKASVDDPERWAQIAKALGRTGTFAKGAYTIAVTREDLWVNNELGDIPAAALESQIHFFKCPCGRTSVSGRLIVADYELNDVIDELQTDGVLKIAGMSPMLMREKPRVMTIFFQGDGNHEALAKNIKGALSYTGDQRMPALKKPE